MESLLLNFFNLGILQQAWPYLLRGVGMTALLCLVVRWNGYFWAMVLLRSEEKVPLAVYLKRIIVDLKADDSMAARLDRTNPLTVPGSTCSAVSIMANGHPASMARKIHWELITHVACSEARRVPIAASVSLALGTLALGTLCTLCT